MKKLSESYREHDLSDLIEGLNTTLSYYNKQFGLNQGGCVFTAAVITEHLENNNIEYQLAAYADQDVDMSDLNHLIEDGNLIHLSVIIDGTEIDEVSQQDIQKNHWSKQVYDSFNSDDLYTLYDSCDWNGEWEVKRNHQLKSQIEEIFMFTI